MRQILGKASVLRQVTSKGAMVTRLDFARLARDAAGAGVDTPEASLASDPANPNLDPASPAKSSLSTMTAERMLAVAISERSSVRTCK